MKLRWVFLGRVDTHNQSEDEQNEVLSKVLEIKEEYKRKGWGWNRLKGDSITRIVEHYLKKHLPRNIKLTRCGFVEGSGIEFDLLVVDKQAKAKKFTNVFSKDHVHLLIEVKGASAFYRQKDVEKLKKWKDRVCEVKKHILYLSFWERSNYYDKLLKIIGRDDVFVLQVNNKTKQGEWKRFVRRLVSLLPSVNPNWKQKHATQT